MVLQKRSGRERHRGRPGCWGRKACGESESPINDSSFTGRVPLACLPASCRARSPWRRGSPSGTRACAAREGQEDRTPCCTETNTQNRQKTKKSQHDRRRNHRSTQDNKNREKRSKRLFAALSGDASWRKIDIHRGARVERKRERERVKGGGEKKAIQVQACNLSVCLSASVSCCCC